MKGPSESERVRIRFPPFTFDPRTGELFKDGYPVKLHPQPAKVLALLVSRPGDVVTREEIQKAVWSEDVHVDFDLGLNSCIRQIRIALGDDAENSRYVDTVPRVGYRFVAGLDRASDTESEPKRSPARVALALAALALLATFVALAVAFLRPSRQGDLPPSLAQSTIAVLQFDNLSGDASLDWLRTGLMDMLVTDLARLSNVNIVSTDRLLQIVSDADALDAVVTSERIVHEVATKTEASRVVLGSFLKAGESIRINVRVQDVRTGEILTTAMVEGAGDSGIFSMVDDLSRRLRASLAMPSVPGQEPAMPFTDYSTSSLEAYRYFIEGHSLLRRSKSREALLLYQKAAEQDPEWARAVNMVAVMYSNIGLEKEAEDYARRAFELDRRLHPKERYFIEGFYYALHEETYGQAVEKIRKHIELGGEIASHHVLARRLFLLERVDEAIDHWEILTGAESPLPLWMAYDHLALAYSHQGRFDEAYQIIESFIPRFPDRSEAYAGLGDHWIRAGSLDAAIEAFETAEAMDPTGLATRFGRFDIAVLREDWREAEAAMKPLTTLRSPTSKWESLRRLALVSLYRGDTGKAVDLLDQAALLYEHPRSRSAAARTQAAHALLARQQNQRALELARQAQREGEGNYPEWEGLFYEALALAAMGRMKEAESFAVKLKERTQSMPTQKEARRHLFLAGELAFSRGETEVAIVELEKARSMLLPRGFAVVGKDPPPHVPIWFSLASAYLDAGQEEKASEWFARIVESENEHIWWPIPYVRSFYFLARVHESRGDTEVASEYYRRFYDYWKDGDLDRGRVEEARSKLVIKEGGGLVAYSSGAR